MLKDIINYLESDKEMTQIVDERLKKMCDECHSHLDKPCAWLSLGNEYCEEIMNIQQELQRKDNIINELKDLCELKKARMLNEKDYSKWYVENYDNAIHTLNLSHSGVMLETIKSAVIKTCDDVLD